VKKKKTFYNNRLYFGRIFVLVDLYATSEIKKKKSKSKTKKPMLIWGGWRGAEGTDSAQLNFSVSALVLVYAEKSRMMMMMREKHLLLLDSFEFSVE